MLFANWIFKMYTKLREQTSDMVKQVVKHIAQKNEYRYISLLTVML